ncbi:MAG: PIN domain-containing protein [Verrucomicrobiaceae bacterium]|nr:MAG: PIN domain-containing protein [Verrucomicrobiaceae bacterium]
MLYFDSNYLFRLYSTEAGYEQVQALADQSDGIAITSWARAEFASILLCKRRESAFSPQTAEEVLLQFEDDLTTGAVTLLAVDDAVMRHLETTLRTAPASTFLRATDALHLACAAHHGFTEVYSRDRHFLAAAALFGLRGINIIPDDSAEPNEKRQTP